MPDVNPFGSPMNLTIVAADRSHSSKRTIILADVHNGAPRPDFPTTAHTKVIDHKPGVSYQIKGPLAPGVDVNITLDGDGVIEYTEP